MARVEPITITLANCEFLIRPLTVAQVEDIERTMADTELAKKPIRHALAILKVGFQRDYADVRIADLEATGPDIAKAMMDILRQGGFLPATPPGEAPAAALITRNDGSASEGA